MDKKITIRNITKHIAYEPNNDFDGDNGVSCAIFTWDYDNEKIDNIADREFKYNLSDKKKSLMWIEKLKEVANWKKGEYLYAFTKTNADGYYNVFYKKDKGQFNWYNIIVEPNGYVCMEAFNHYTMDKDEDIKFSMYIRVESIYNDKNCNSL
tara:strand:- start:322 stop:777 length:456 start_codon:yes stop_codon:yes gene_type:complete